VTATTTVRSSPRPAPWRDVRVLRFVAQLTALIVTYLVVRFLWSNFVANTDEKNIDRDFGFLEQPANFNIQGSSFDRSNSVREAIGVGIKNTFASVIVGAPLALVLGTLIGIARLSKNWLLAKISAVFVELVRNTPPLIVIFVVNFALVLRLPVVADAWTPGGVFVVSNFRLAGPSIATHANAGLFNIVLVLAGLVALAVAVFRTRFSDRTGEPHRRVLWAGGTFLAISAVAYVALGGPHSVSLPRIDGRKVSGGFGTLAPYVALTGALTVYTASHIAEIVRGSILAVPGGQSEAAEAVALNGFQRYRYVVLPQAFRIAIPPVINQFLNYTKNTSLALAVAYAEITFIMVTVIGNGQPATQNIVVLMGTYLLFSLSISVLLNIVNRRLQLVGR